MVLQALQLQRPTATLQRINNANSNFFIFVVFLDVIDVARDRSESEGRYEDAAGGVLGLSTHVDTYAFTFRYVTYLGHELSEARRPSHLQGVRSGRDDIVGILQRCDTDAVCSKGEVHRSGDGVPESFISL